MGPLKNILHSECYFRDGPFEKKPCTWNTIFAMGPLKNIINREYYFRDGSFEKSIHREYSFRDG